MPKADILGDVQVGPPGAARHLLCRLMSRSRCGSMVMWGNSSETGVTRLFSGSSPDARSKLLGYTEIIDNPSHPQRGPSGVYDLILFSKAINLSAQGDGPILNR